MKKNNRFKAYRKTFLVLAILLFTILIFILPTIKALDLFSLDIKKIDDKIKKTYNPDTKTIELKDDDINNILGGQIIKQTLTSNPIYQVEGLGEQLVQRYTVDVYEEIDNPFRDYEIYDVIGNKSTPQAVKIKYGIPYGVEYTTTYTQCTNDKDCKIISKNITEIKTLWVDFNSDQLKKLLRGRYDIGVFTNVNIGDYKEGIPLWFGQRIPEFATWNSTFEEGLITVLQMEEADTPLIDTFSGYHNYSKVSTPDFQQTGINNYGVNLDNAANEWFVNASDTGNMSGGSLTFSVWVKPTSFSNWQTVVAHGNQDDDGSYYMQIGDPGKVRCQVKAGGSKQSATSGDNMLSTGQWSHLMLVIDYANKDCKVYINGTLQADGGSTISAINAVDFINYIGRDGNAAVQDLDAVIDEYYVWSSVKGASFAASLYDGGTGTFYSAVAADNAPTTTLNTPINQTGNNNTFAFNASSTDDNGILEVRFYINDTLNKTYTNTSASQTYLDFNITYYMQDGVYNWTAEAEDTVGQNSTKYYRTLTVDATAPNISTPLNLSTFSVSSFPFSWILNVSVSDPLLADCWYYHTDNTTIIKYTCNVTKQLNFTSAGTKTIYYYANDSYNNIANRNDTLTLTQIVENASYEGSVQEDTSTHISLGLFTSENITQYNGTLIYNGTKQTTTNLTINTTYVTFNTTLTTPLVSTDTAIGLSWHYYINNVSYNSTAYSQTVTDIGTVGLSTNCSNGLVAALTFHFEDEINDSYLTADYVGFNFQYGVTNPYDTQSNGNFSTVSSFSLCINDTVSNNYTLGTAEIEYELDNFGDREYYLINSSISNETVNVTLYLLHNTEYDKYFFNLREGTTDLEGYRVLINKYFISEAQYNNIGIRMTDNEGDFVEYLEPDKDYRFFIFDPNNNLVTSIDRTATCLTAPCSISLNTLTASGSVYSGYYDRIGIGVYSNLSFNSTTKVVTLDYVDALGTAVYGKLVVEQILLNDTSVIICNNSLSATSGTITCNLSAYDNLDFVAAGYISRSPALPFDWIFGVIKETIETLGIMGVFITLLLLITIVFAFRGDLVLGTLAIPMALTILKIASFLPLGWGSIAIVWGLAFLISYLIKV